MMSEHSAMNPCVETVSCGSCFNNLVDHRGFVLMMTPKVASQSIVDVYKQNNGGRVCEFRSRAYIEHRCADFLKIATVRNPFDRLVSCWKDKTINQYHRTWSDYGIESGDSFDEFARKIVQFDEFDADKHWRSQSFELKDDTGFSMFDVLVRFESMADDWMNAVHEIEAECGVVLNALPHKHKSNHKHYSLYYDKELVEIVGDYYHNDLINYEYGFELCQ